jgi:DNA-binding XRE family transcriptional regulator
LTTPSTSPTKLLAILLASEDSAPGDASTYFAVLVRLLRERKGLTQKEFARELNVTVGTLGGWENGHHRPLNTQRKRLLLLAVKAGIQAPLPASLLGSGKAQ